ncbi:unnamed protein product [Arabis nemorensis]|uniref:Uncharacterized protein n=1 Tax=Arabis nemorensis TaxID=586526 RepID=A0A565CIE0_9BRAS|nr:unnamed protein product [Arabis nemorensis]
MVTHHHKEVASVQLRWSVHTVNISSFGCPRHNHCKCQNLKDSETGYSTCTCPNGYSSNPSTSDGCKDIDECQMLHVDGKLKYCGGGTSINEH